MLTFQVEVSTLDVGMNIHSYGFSMAAKVFVPEPDSRKVLYLFISSILLDVFSVFGGRLLIYARFELSMYRSTESLFMSTPNPSGWNTSGASVMGGSLGGQGHLRGLAPDAAAHGHPSSYAVGASGSGRYPNAAWASQWSNPGALGRGNGVAGAYAHSQPMMLHPSGAGAYTSYQGSGASANTSVAMTGTQAVNYAQRNNAAAMMGDDDVAEEDWLEATKAFAL